MLVVIIIDDLVCDKIVISLVYNNTGWPKRDLFVLLLGIGNVLPKKIFYQYNNEW